MHSSTLSLTSALDVGGRLIPRLGRFTPQEWPGIHCIGGRVGRAAGLGERVKCRPPSPQGFDPRTVQHRASRYIGYSIPVQWWWLRWLRIPSFNRATKLYYTHKSLPFPCLFQPNSLPHTYTHLKIHLTQSLRIHPGVARKPTLPFPTEKLHKSQVTIFCTVAPNIFRYSVWNLLHFTFQAPTILKWLLLANFV